MTDHGDSPNTDEWVAERRARLERLANSEYSSAWVAESLMENADTEDSR